MEIQIFYKLTPSPLRENSDSFKIQNNSGSAIISFYKFSKVSMLSICLQITMGYKILLPSSAKPKLHPQLPATSKQAER